MVLDSDDEEDEPPKKVTPKKPTPKAAKKEEKLEPTTTSDYFSSNGKNKIKRTAPVRPKKVKPIPKVEVEEENYIDDDDDLDVGIFAEQFKKNEDGYVEEPHDEEMDDFVVPDGEEDEEEEVAKPKRKPAATTKKRTPVLEDGEKEEEAEVLKPKRKPAAAKKRSLPSDDEDEDEAPKSKARKPAAKKARTPAAKKKKEEIVEDEEVKKILDSVPTIRAPTPPPRAEDGKKFNFRDFKARSTAAPAASGSVELPEGAENCLAGLTFVFTGVLNSLSREDGQQLVKKYGGYVSCILSTF